MSQGTVYTIEIVGNNKSSGTISYTYNGVSQSVAVQKFDLYINGTLVGDDLTPATLTAGSTVNSMFFTGVSSTANVANIFVDDVSVYNAVPSAIGVTTYTVTYAANGGTGSVPTDGSSPYNSGSTVTVLGNTGGLTKTGYTFGGWSTTLNGSAVSSFTISANTTLYAVWLPTYSVTYDANDGSGAPTDSNLYTNGATVTVSGTIPTLTGYDFDGWSTTLNGSVSYAPSATFTMGSANVTLYAHWTAAGAADTETAISSSSASITYGDTVTLTATVSPTPTDGSTVTFKDGSTALGTGLTTGGSATYTTTEGQLAVGTHSTITATLTGDGSFAGSTSPNLTALTVATKALTLSGATVVTTTYPVTNTTFTATATNGVVGDDVVTITKTGYFTNANAGTSVAFTSTATLGGADAANYTLTQPTGLTGTINKADQTITGIPASTNAAPGNTIVLTNLASSGLTISYASDTPSVATVSGNTITAVAVGSATITASQAGNGNYNAAPNVTMVVTVAATPVTLARWYYQPWVAGNTVSPLAATTLDSGLSSAQLAVAGLTLSGSGARYNVSGWQASTLANSNITVTLTAASGKALNLNGQTLVGAWGSSGTGPTNFFVYSSVDNYAASIGKFDRTTSGAAAVTTITLPVSGYNKLSTITFKILGLGATATGGTGGPTNLVVNGFVGTVYTVTYDGNTSTGGAQTDASLYSFNDTVTVLGAGTLVKAGYTFTGWNTMAGGGGTSYGAGDTFTISANTTLYAQWTENSDTPTTTTISGPATATYGDTATFTATVAPTPANGTLVSFYDDGNLLGTGTTASGTATYTTTASQLAVGTHSAITASFAGGSGYAASASDALSPALVISPKALSISGTTIADKAYNATTTAGTVLVGTLDGFVGDETVAATATATAYSSADVGTYPTTVHYTLVNGANGGLAANYSLADDPVNGTITNKLVTITANSVSKTMGTALTSPGSSATNFVNFGASGFLSGEVAVLTATVTYGDGAAADAALGTYVDAVTVSDAVVTGAGAYSAENYLITYVAGDITVQYPALAGWEVSGTASSTGPLAPHTTNADVTVGSLTLGSGVGTTTTTGAWRGNNWQEGTDETTAIAAGNYETFTITANSGYAMSLATIPAYTIGRSSTGPSNGVWQVSVGSSAFVDIGTMTNTSTSDTWMSAIDLSGIAALQNIPAGTVVTFRIVNWGASGSGGTWYIGNSSSTGDDLQVLGTVSPILTMAASKNTTAALLKAKVLAKAAGSGLTVTAVSDPAHGSVTTNATYIYYTPATDFVGADSFTCTLSDGTTVLVNVTVTDPSNPTSSGNGSNLIIHTLDANTVRVIILGTPSLGYVLQTNGSGVSTSGWGDYKAFTMPSVGLTNFDDPIAPGARFYRTVLP